MLGHAVGPEPWGSRRPGRRDARQDVAVEQEQRRVASAAGSRGQPGGQPYRLEVEFAGRIIRDTGVIPGGCKGRHAVSRRPQVEGSARGLVARSTLSESWPGVVSDLTRNSSAP